MTDLADYLWIIWISFILLCIIIELLTLDFTFLMVAVGSLGGLAANLLGLDWWLQITVGLLLSLGLILALRPFLLRAMRKGEDPAPSNVPALIGLSGTVLPSAAADVLLVKLANGETWTARLDAAAAAGVSPGDSITVTAIEGSTARVVPRQQTESK